MAKITFNPPIHIGDLSGGLDIDQLRVATFSFNMQKSYSDQSKAVLSIGLEHPASGYCYTVTYLDAQALTYARAINTANFSVTPFDAQLLQKLVADGKLPANGTVV